MSCSSLASQQSLIRWSAINNRWNNLSTPGHIDILFVWKWLSAFSKSYTSLLRRWPSPPLNRQLSLSMDPSRWTTPNLRFLKSSNIVYVLFCKMNIFSESYGGCLGPALPPLWDISQVFKINAIRFPYIISRLPLRTDAFRLGRAKSCDYVIR